MTDCVTAAEVFYAIVLLVLMLWWVGVGEAPAF
jgi:hypothetical protein